MKKTVTLICCVLILECSIFALAQEVQSPNTTEIKDLAKEVQYHAKLDSYNILYPLAEDQAYEKGEALAAEDFENGNYRILVYGLRPTDATASEEYLSQTYDVEFFPIAGCIVSDGIVGGTKGYNTTMKALLREKYGKDIFREAETAESE